MQRAYADPGSEAWREYHLGIFNLTTRYPSRWQEDWATTGLRTLCYEYEDQFLTYHAPPKERRSPTDFVAWLPEKLPTIDSGNTPLVKFLLEGDVSQEQWRIYAAAMICRGRVHHRNLGHLAENIEDEERVCFVYRMLGDEGGQGDYNAAHATLVAPFLKHLGGGPEDVQKVADLFEMKVLANWMNRCFLHKSPIWGAAAICYLEHQAGREFTMMLPRVRQVGFPEEVLEFFTVHGGELDLPDHGNEVEYHNRMCRELVGSILASPDDVGTAYTAMVRAGEVFRDAFAATGRLMGV